MTSAPQSDALHRYALPLPHWSIGKGQATSLQAGRTAPAAAPRSTRRSASKAYAPASPPRAKAATARMTVVLRMGVTGSAAGAGPLALPEELVSVLDLGPVGFGLPDQLDKLLVVGAGGVAVAELFGGFGRTGIAAET